MNRKAQILFFAPCLVVFALMVLLPSTITLVDSFYRFQDGSRHFVGGLYYRFAAGDPRFHLSLSNNLVYMGWTLLFEVVIGLGLALALEKDTRTNSLLRMAFFSPNVLSLVVVGLMFGFLFKDGVGVFPGMLSETRALLTISVISGWAYCGFYMVIFLAGLSAIPVELLEAARLDGAGKWQSFWRIRLPLLKNTFFVALVICFTGAFKAFDLFWVLLPNQDHGSIVSTLLVKEVLRFDNRGYASALAVILTLLVIGIFGLIELGRRAWGFQNDRREGRAE